MYSFEHKYKRVTCSCFDTEKQSEMNSGLVFKSELKPVRHTDWGTIQQFHTTLRNRERDSEGVALSQNPERSYVSHHTAFSHANTHRRMEKWDFLFFNLLKWKSLGTSSPQPFCLNEANIRFLGSCFQWNFCVLWFPGFFSFLELHPVSHNTASSFVYNANEWPWAERGEVTFLTI